MEGPQCIQPILSMCLVFPQNRAISEAQCWSLLLTLRGSETGFDK